MSKILDESAAKHVFKPLQGKNILFGISGGIACFKAAEYVRNLTKEGAGVQAILTANATRFVTENTFSALSGQKAMTDMFDPSKCFRIPHINMARQADLFIILPATANIIAKLAHGIADDLLTTLFLSFTRQILIFPSMNPDMYSHPATQANIDILRSMGFTVVEPDSGTVVCGDRGKGRLPGWKRVLFHIRKALSRKTLQGKKVLVTAGPTREPVDPVRYISNRSSGKMGYSIAEAASIRGASVQLVSGPVCLPPPGDTEIDITRVETASEMARAVFSAAESADIIIMAAAVSDYTPVQPLEHKMKKSTDKMTLKLQRTTDILQELGLKKKQGLVLAGFCAESRDLKKHAIEKLRKKNLDLIIANDVTMPGAGFDVDTNAVLLIDREENVVEIPVMDKRAVAEHILDMLQDICSQGPASAASC